MHWLAEALEADEDELLLLADPNHEEHQGMKEWVGDFDPEKFEPKIATVRMVRG
jgi:hypothetical protein